MNDSLITMKTPLTRRAFAGAAGAAALGFAACDRRSPLAPDLRAPSAPVGLKVRISAESIVLSWEPHSGNDFTGVRSESQIQFMVYRDGYRITVEPLSEPQYEDLKTLPGVIYTYTVTAVDAAGNEGAPSAPLRTARGVSRKLVVYRSDLAVSGTLFNPDKIRDMLFTAVKDFSGKNDTGSAFETFFPGLDASKTVGIKVNTLAGSKLSTHPAVVEAVVEGLSLMLGGTFPPANITVFDDRGAAQMEAAGFVLRDPPAPYRCVSTYGQWSSTLRTIGGTGQRLSLTAESSDYIVNVPVLKDHSEAGVTFSLKNMYGLVSQPGLMHANYCDPMVAEVYSLVRDKVRLIVGDALFGAHRNGPDASPTFAPKALYIGVDPVALDLYALSVINTERVRRGLIAIGFGPSDAGRHISTAGGPDYELGDLAFLPSTVTEVSI